MSFRLPDDHPDYYRYAKYRGDQIKVTHEQFHAVAERRVAATGDVVLDHVIRIMECFSCNTLTRGPMAVLAKALDGATLENVKLFHLAVSVAIEDEYDDAAMYELLKRVASRDVDYCSLIVEYRALIFSSGFNVFMRMISDANMKISIEAAPFAEVLSALTTFQTRDVYGNHSGNRGFRILSLIPLVASHPHRSADIASFILKRREVDPVVIGAYLEMAASSALLEGAL